MVPRGPDDLPAPGPENQVSFTGDGERADVDEPPPAAGDPPLTQPSRRALRASGDGAARRILASLSIAPSEVGPAIDDAALALRLVAAARALPPSDAEPRRQSWSLRAGVTASRALGEWLAGADLADGATALVAVQLDVVRAVIGDARFDACFGPARGEPTFGRLVVGPDLLRTPIEPLLRYTVKEPRAGDWFLFRNRAVDQRGPMLRPDRFLCLGEADGQLLWAGLGLIAGEAELLAAMRTAQPNAVELGVDRESGVALSARALAELIAHRP